jgi:PST family polysaccharide transporter
MGGTGRRPILQMSRGRNSDRSRSAKPPLCERDCRTMVSTRKAAGGENRRVLNNFLFLSAVQFANYLAPLIVLPYLFRVLGDSRYGLIELARALSVYFLTVTDYGFSLSATREVSVNREDPQKISEVFSAVMLLKLLLVVLSLLTLGLIVLVVPKLRSDWLIYILTFGNVVGQWLFPIWLFRGYERMFHITTLTVAAKTLVVVSIFIFIRDSSDYLYVPLLQSGGSILMGLAGLILALRSFHVRFHVPPVNVLKREFKNGWHIFISKMATTMHATSNIVILGLLTDPVFVAYYAAGEKIVRAATDGLLVPLSQAIFPHVGRLASQSRQTALRFAARVGGLLSIATLTMSAGLLLGASYITRVVLGPDAQGGATVIRILSFLPFLIGLNHFFGVQIMVNFGLKRLLARILITAGALNVIMVVLLAVPLKHIGVALASLAVEVFIVTTMCIALRRNGVHVFGAFRKDVDNQGTPA